MKKVLKGLATVAGVIAVAQTVKHTNETARKITQVQIETENRIWELERQLKHEKNMRKIEDDHIKSMNDIQTKHMRQRVADLEKKTFRMELNNIRKKSNETTALAVIS